MTALSGASSSCGGCVAIQAIAAARTEEAEMGRAFSILTLIAMGTLGFAQILMSAL
jgi:hypothetical protein